jgi:SAM-dependent methyltransferase
MKKLQHLVYWTIIYTSRKIPFSRNFISYASLYFYRLWRGKKKFLFQGKSYYYFYHIYNQTFASERIVEISIAKNIVDDYKNKKILEIGNVLSHYFKVNHDVVDRFEQGKNVINEDVARFKMKRKFDLIVSISTMEHVGYIGDDIREPEKFELGIKNLKRHLKKGGVLFVTLPIFFNPYLTNKIKTKKMPFNEEYFLTRISYLNEWKEVSFKEALKSPGYDDEFANSNSLYIGIFKK